LKYGKKTNDQIDGVWFFEKCVSGRARRCNRTLHAVNLSWVEGSTEETS